MWVAVWTWCTVMGDVELKPGCVNGHQMSRQLCSTKTRGRNLELGDSQPRGRDRLGSLLSTALKRVVKETGFTFAVSKELLQTTAREDTDKGVRGMSPSCAEDVPCSSLERLCLPPSDPVACGGGGGTTSGVWPLLPIDRAKERAAAL